MSLQACADIVAKGDPERFAAAMAAPVAARKILFPIYAFNVEVTRAAWIASEPMIGEMRLQWWRDALEEIGQGREVRKHEVATPLAEVLKGDSIQDLDRLIQARRWDLYTNAFEDADHFQDYIARTSAIMWTSARLLGADASVGEHVNGLARATALARFLAAVADLEGRGRIPLVDGRAEAIQALCVQALADVATSADLKRAVPKAARPALLEGWQAVALLKRAQKNPQLVADGALRLSEFEKRARLIWASFTQL